MSKHKHYQPDRTRTVYQESVNSPPPYPTRHACKRWDERSSYDSLTCLDAWHLSLNIAVHGDEQVVEARLFAPDDIVMLGIRDASNSLLIKTVKYRDWIEEEDKMIPTDHFTECPCCENLYNKGEGQIGCRWCQDGLTTEKLLKTFETSFNPSQWGR